MRYQACGNLVLGDGGRVWECQVDIDNPAYRVGFILAVGNTYNEAKRNFWTEVRYELPNTHLTILKTRRGN